MPLANKKPPLNHVVTITMTHNGRKPGMWDGANWWVEIQSNLPMVPIVDTFIKEWVEVTV